MKLKFLILLFLLNISSANAQVKKMPVQAAKDTQASSINSEAPVQAVSSQEDKTVILTVSAQGATLSEAKQNALRDAIEQAFGAFISSNTEIFNDELVKDEIVSVSNGNIQDYEVISEVKLHNGNYAITLKATVSVNKLSAFVESKGVEVEFKGNLLAVNVKQQILNEKNEIKTIENIDNISRKILDKSYDYEIIRGEPKQDLPSAGSTNGWIIPLQIDVKFNENIEQFRDYFYNSVSALSMSESEIQKYKDLGKKSFTIGLGKGDEITGVWNNYQSLTREQRLYHSKNKKKLIKIIEQYFDLIKQKHPLVNFKYQLRSPTKTELETENIADLVAWFDQKHHSSMYMESVNSRGGIDIIYSDVSVKSTYTFRTETAFNTISNIINSIRSSSLNFEITNGVHVIDRTYFDKEFNSHSFKYRMTRGPIISNNSSILSETFTPFYSTRRLKYGFWSYFLVPQSRPPSGYYDLLRMKFSFTQSINMSKMFRGTKEYSHGCLGCFNFNIPIISLYDFNNTNKVILSLYYEDLLTLSELEKVDNYKIYPTN